MQNISFNKKEQTAFNHYRYYSRTGKLLLEMKDIEEARDKNFWKKTEPELAKWDIL